MQKVRLLESIVFNLLQKHPWPWSIEYDWTAEVYDSSSKLVIKLQDQEAKNLLKIARQIHKINEKWKKEQAQLTAKRGTW